MEPEKDLKTSPHPPGMENLSEECLSQQELLELANQSESEVPPHVKDCEICLSALKILQDKSRVEQQIQSFLATIQREAEESEAARPISLFTYLKAYFGIRDVALSTAGLILVLLALFVFLQTQRRNTGMLSEARSPVLPADTVGMGLETLWDYYLGAKADQQLFVSKVDKAGLKAFYQERAKLSQMLLDEKHRWELADVAVQFQALLQERQNRALALLEAGAPKNVAPMEIIASLPPVDEAQQVIDQKVAELYIRVGASYVAAIEPKSGLAQKLSQLSMGQENLTGGTVVVNNAYYAQAIQLASEQIKPVFTNKDNLVAKDLNPNRGQEELRALEKGVKDFSAQAKVNITYQPLSLKVGSSAEQIKDQVPLKKSAIKTGAR